MKTHLKILLLITLLALLLSACQSATEAPAVTDPAATATAPSTATTAPTTTTAPAGDTPTQAPAPTTGAAQAYPAGTDAQPAVAPTIDAGAYPPPSNVQVLENRSLVRAELSEIKDDNELPGFVGMVVTIRESQAVEGMPSRTDDLIGQQVILFTEPAVLPDLKPGDIFTAEVEYRGDESGGRYFATNIQKQ